MLVSDSSDAEIEVLEDRLSERTDSKFDDNTRNSISSETSSFEVIRTPRDNLPPRSKPISTPVSPSKENPVSSTPRGSKEFPNLAVKFPVQPPELPKSCGWKQESLIHYCWALSFAQILYRIIRFVCSQTVYDIQFAQYRSCNMIQIV